MNDLQLANEFLKLLVTKAHFNPVVTTAQGAPLTIDKCDVAAYLQYPLIKKLVVTLRGRLVSKYEWERLKILSDPQSNQAEAVAATVKCKALQQKQIALVRDNGIDATHVIVAVDKLKEEVAQERKKMADARLAYLSKKGQALKVVRENSSELRKHALLRVGLANSQTWIESLP